MSTYGVVPARVPTAGAGNVPPGPAPYEPLKTRRAANRVTGKSAGAQRKFEASVNALERVADLLVVIAGVFAAFGIYEALQLGRHLQYPPQLVAGVALFFALLFVYLMDWDGGYQRGNSLLRIRETERILRVAAKAFLFVFPITFLAGHLFSRWLLILAIVIVPSLLVAEKQLFLQCVRWMHMKGHGVENVLIYGAGFTGRKVFSALARSPAIRSSSVRRRAVLARSPALAPLRLTSSHSFS